MDCPGCTTVACLVLVTSILQITAENVLLRLKNHCFGANTPCIRCGERPCKKQCFRKLENGSKCRLKIPEFGPFFRSKSQVVAKFRSWLLIAQGNLPSHVLLCNVAFVKCIPTLGKYRTYSTFHVAPVYS